MSGPAPSSSVPKLDRFEIDESAAPLIRVVYPDDITEESYRQLFEVYVALCDRYPRIGWLVDMRRFNPMTTSSALRKAAADVFTAARPRLLQSTVCEARVVSSTAVRGILMAFDWLTGSKWPVKNVATVKDAEAWIAEQLRR